MELEEWGEREGGGLVGPGVGGGLFEEGEDLGGWEVDVECTITKNLA